MTEQYLHLTRPADAIAGARSLDGIRAISGPAIVRVLRERLEQIERHGHDAAHDDVHDAGEIGHAAFAYLAAGLSADMRGALGPLADSAAALAATADAVWPWEPELFRPHDYETCLTKAAAMILAELDRVARAKEARHG